MQVRSCMTDPEEFTAIYRQNSSGIFRFAVHMSGSRTVAEEVTQEAFLMLINSPGSFDPEKGTITNFLYGVARNLVKRHLERDRRQQYLDDFEEEFAAPANDLLGDLTQRENLNSLRCAVASLPPKYREVIVLCDLQELSYEGASEAIGCAVGTVRSRLHRGRALLIGKMQTRCVV
jgi:RNA polymerase sigma-70 factor (ECF subfamily)